MNRELLEKPFSPDQIRTRDSGHGPLDYIEGALIIQRLNDAFNADWSFEILDHRIHTDEVLILGRLTAGGVSKTQFGKSSITLTKIDKTEVSLGDDLKAAVTDCIKKCATLFGVGLHMYFDPPPPPVTETTRVSVATRPVVASLPPSNDKGRRLTAPQLSAIFAIAKSQRWSQKDIQAFSMDKFGRQPDFLSVAEASAFIDHLKAPAGDRRTGPENGGRQ